jgi:predicted MFS family arabinose efflux permease
MNDSKNGWFAWIVCVSASLFLFYEFVQGNMFASIAEDIMQSFNIEADKMAYLSSAYYLSNVIFLFFAGYTLDKYSNKDVILIAMLLCVGSTFMFAKAKSFWIAFLCRFLMGIGSAFCFLGPVKIASNWFKPHQMALVTGVIVTVAMTGGMVAQYPMTYLVSTVGWRSAMFDVAWLGVLIWAIMAFLVQESNIQQANHNSNFDFSLLKKIFLTKQIVFPALYTSLMNMAIAVFGAMMGILYLSQKMGISKGDAAAINSFLFFGSLLGGPIIGFISDKLRKRLLPMFLCALGSFVVFLFILYGQNSITSMKVWFFLLGLLTSGQIISYPMVAESSPENIVAQSVSVVSILTQGGYIIYQNLFGWILSMHKDTIWIKNIPKYTINAYQNAATIFIVGLILAMSLLLFIKETSGKRLNA